MTTPPYYENIINRPTLVSPVAGRFSYARRHGRGNLLAETKVAVVPFVEPWTISTDTNGHGFPSDIVAVRASYVYTETTAEAQDQQVAVPSVLPSGYSPRLGQEDLWTAIASGGPGLGNWSPLPAVPTGSEHVAITSQNTLRGATTCYPITYLPEQKGASAFYASEGGNSSGLTTATAGFRYIRSTVNPLYWGAGVTLFRAKLGYMNNFATPEGFSQATGATFDNLLWQSSNVASGGSYDSGFLDHDGATYNWHAPFGTRKKMIAVCEVYDPTRAIPGWYYLSGYAGMARLGTWSFGYRCDLAYPFTLFGPASGSLVAPGGVVPGSFPGY